MMYDVVLLGVFFCFLFYVCSKSRVGGVGEWLSIAVDQWIRLILVFVVNDCKRVF